MLSLPLWRGATLEKLAHTQQLTDCKNDFVASHVCQRRRKKKEEEKEKMMMMMIHFLCRPCLPWAAPRLPGRR